MLVELTCPRPGCEIRHTIDGTAPSVSSPRYAGPIAIGRTTTLRVAELVRGAVVSDRAAFTYVFPGEVPDQEGMAPATNPTVGRAIEAALAALPIVAITADHDALFGSAGVLLQTRRKARTPAFVEMVEPGGAVVFRSAAAIWPHSRAAAKRSLRLMFTGPHASGPITADLFGREETFRRLLLRGGSNDAFFGDLAERATYTRDQWVRESQIAMNGAGARGRFVHLFLAGRYHGVYNLVEWPGRELAARQLGGDPKDWRVIRHRIERTHEPNADVEAMHAAIGRRDAKGLARRIDPKLFFDYLILEWYAGVGDGIDNNWIAIHRKAAPLRFLAWDAEYMFVDANPHPPSSAGARVQPAFVPGTPEAKRLERTLMVGAFETFMTDRPLRALLMERARHHAAGALADERAIARWRAVNEPVGRAIDAEIGRWGAARGASREKWERAVLETERAMAGNAERLTAAVRAFLDRRARR